MCCATKNKLLIIIICKAPWSHAQRKKTYVGFFPADIFTSTDIEEFLREAACMKEFDHPHVTKLIGKPALLLVELQSTSRSCTVPHSLTYAPPLLSNSSVSAATSVLSGVVRISALLLPRPRGSWSVCKRSQHLPLYTGNKHFLFKPFIWFLQILHGECGWLRNV